MSSAPASQAFTSTPTASRVTVSTWTHLRVDVTLVCSECSYASSPLFMMLVFARWRVTSRDLALRCSWWRFHISHFDASHCVAEHHKRWLRRYSRLEICAMTSQSKRGAGSQHGGCDIENKDWSESVVRLAVDCRERLRRQSRQTSHSSRCFNSSAAFARPTIDSDVLIRSASGSVARIFSSHNELEFLWFIARTHHLQRCSYM